MLEVKTYLVLIVKNKELNTDEFFVFEKSKEAIQKYFSLDEEKYSFVNVLEVDSQFISKDSNGLQFLLGHWINSYTPDFHE